jgi:N-acyl-D-amino-acid deacylase
MENNILIKSGMVMDGTGKAAERADLLIRGDRIEDVGIFPDAKADKVIDAKNLAVAPGFIDVHTHLDFFLTSPRHPEVMERWVRQGVTTIVAGNCGYSPAPMLSESEETVKTYWNFACPNDGIEFEWSSMAEYFDCLERKGLAYNVAVLTGHNLLRLNAMGMQARRPSQDEMSAMKAMLRDSIEAGSIGLSLGLFYVPGCFSRTDELMELASVLTDFGAPMAVHTRGLSDAYDKAVEEVIHVAENNAIPLQLSHHIGGIPTGSIVNPAEFKAKLSLMLGKILGERCVIKNQVKTMPAHVRANELIRKARDRGLEVGHDMLPWLCAFTSLLGILPPKLFAGGMAKMFEQLGDPDVRKRLIREKETVVPQWPNWDHDWWVDNYFSGAFQIGGFKLEKNRRYENMMLQDIAKERGTDLYNTAFDLIVEEKGRVFFNYSIGDQTISDWIGAWAVSDPHCSIITDIVGVDYNPNPVPSSYGSFTKVLGQFARDRGYMSQEEAIRKMTSLPAGQMRLKDRGVLKKGAFADITVFNPKTVNNRATLKDPNRFSVGIEYVLINGKPVLERGTYDAKTLAGKVIKQ